MYYSGDSLQDAKFASRCKIQSRVAAVVNSCRVAATTGNQKLAIK
jgi:hypothetical protein